MKLVINGDDLGYTMANTMGIFQGYTDGILRSTTALTNSKYFAKAMEMAKVYPGLGIGVHLTLTLGKPLTANKTLTNPETGEFYRGAKTIWEKNPDYDEIYDEWKAQIERYIAVAGHLPTHLDSHHHVHDATPQALEVSKRLAEEYGLALRRYGKYKFVSGFGGSAATVETMTKLLEENMREDIEIMVHPGWCDLELYRMSSYATDRLKELDVLCDPRLMKYIKEHQIELCHY